MSEPFNRLYPFRHAASGQVLLNKNDMYVRGAVEATGEFSEAEVALWRDILLPDDTVMEVGANMGVHTLALSRLAKRVYAVEPQPFMFQVLCANLALNSVDNVMAWNGACGASGGSLKVPVLDPRSPQNYGCLNLTQQYDEGVSVPVLAIDSLVMPRLDLLKLDCEGAELSILMGARQTLLKLRPWVYLEFTENRAALLALFEELGYFCVRHIPPIHREPNFAGAKVDAETLKLASDMVLACPMGREPRERMLSPFGERHDFFVADDRDILGQQNVLIQWCEPYKRIEEKA